MQLTPDPRISDLRQAEAAKRRRHLVAATLSLLGISGGPASAEPLKWTIDSGLLYYKEGAGRVQAIEPVVNGSVDLGGDRTLSAGVVLDRQLDVSRGDWIATPASIHATPSFPATLAWLDTEPAVIGRKYWVRHGNRWVQARIAGIENRLDIHTLEAREVSELAVNEIGRVVIETQQPLPVEAYVSNRSGGSLIIVDPTTNRTSGALLVASAGA